MMLIAIHQPNFFPWLGWFDKLARADRFILLDTVQVQLTGGNYTNRTRLLVGGRTLWATMPMVRGHEARHRIADAPIASDLRWRRKLIGTVRQAYARAPFFDLVMPILARLIDYPADRLYDYNVNALHVLADCLHLDSSRFVRASDLPQQGASTELLVSLVRAVGGKAYLTGGGATYQNNELFTKAGIQVERQSFAPVFYPQLNTQDFVPGLSVIDALMNLGFDGTARMLGISAAPEASS